MMSVFLPALRENRMGLDWSKIDYTFVDPDPEETAMLLLLILPRSTRYNERGDLVRQSVMLG
jgi:hypothetical protein